MTLSAAISTALLALAAPIQTAEARDSSSFGAYHLVRNQLSGICLYEPQCVAFFPQAVREIGMFEAVLATADRLTRCSTIGTAAFPQAMKGSDGRIHEGVSSYKRNSPFGKRKTGGGYTESSGVLCDDNVGEIASGGKAVSPEMPFVDYLLGNGLSRDASVYLGYGGFAPSDTLFYLRGLSLYSAGELSPAVCDLKKVGAESAYYDKAVFLAAVSDAYLGRYDESLRILSGYGGEHKSLKDFAIASLSLLKDDREAYLKASERAGVVGYTIAEGESFLRKAYESREERSGKNPWLAAGASAIVPGLGKVYAGRLDEGISSLLTVGVLAAFTAENWVRNGLGDWRTILFGTLGSIFYLGNIYGSYVSVGIYNDTLIDAQNTTILFNLHVPVREFVGR